MKYDTNINKNNNNGTSFKYDTNLNNIKQRTTKSNKSPISTKGALIFIGIVLSIIFIDNVILGNSPTRFDSDDINLDGRVDEVDSKLYMDYLIDKQK